VSNLPASLSHVVGALLAARATHRGVHIWDGEQALWAELGVPVGAILIKKGDKGNRTTMAVGSGVDVYTPDTPALPLLPGVALLVFFGVLALAWAARTYKASGTCASRDSLTSAQRRYSL